MIDVNDSKNDYWPLPKATIVVTDGLRYFCGQANRLEMIRIYILFIISLFVSQTALGADVTGVVTDKATGERLLGCTIYVNELKSGTITGLDGSYILKNLKPGQYNITCNFISYEPQTRIITLQNNADRFELNFMLETAELQLNEVVISATSDRASETSARLSEKNAAGVMNVVSSKAIEISPDMNVAAVIQRMSGVTLDNNTSGSGQYAILRGMDKRYNYTLINGIKIPSTNNKHRYVPLDLFPSDLVDRVEVVKTLSPEMEGDAIAGVVNLVMKNAPDHLTVRANASAGYNSYLQESPVYLFDHEAVDVKSPYESHPSGYYATPSDFPTNHLNGYQAENPIDFTGNLTIGNRFIDNKIGFIVSGSYQRNYKGKTALYFDSNTSNDGLNLPIIEEMNNRTYTQQSESWGVHAKADYVFNRRHKLELYAFQTSINENQVRESDITDLDLNYLPDEGTYLQNHSTRLRYNEQQLGSMTLQGKHQFVNGLDVQWSGVYSKASNLTPDQSTITYNTDMTQYQPEKSFVDFDGSERLWRHNDDRDLSCYLNLSYQLNNWLLKVGGLYRQKERESFKTSYTLKAISTTKPADSVYYAEKGVDWNEYDEIKWRVYNPKGATANGETFDAGEDTWAAYAAFQAKVAAVEVNGGLRVEHTLQDYSMQFPIGQPTPYGSQDYIDFLPSLQLKYIWHQNYQLKASYYRAINKPGFMEIVPCPVVDEDYTSQGNADLTRATADNVDLRVEYFPNPTDQVMVGLFYKHLTNPIEYAFVNISTSSQKVTYSPINSPSAVNMGLELDVIKYFRVFGVKANYTLTRSEITTNKLSRTRDANGDIVPDYNVKQTRPLYGQAEHVANLSLLYKGVQNGINSQVAFAYTGERLYSVSQFVDNDLWQKGFWQLDVSAEKGFSNGICIFAKANNLLNTHTEVYNKKVNPANDGLPYHAANDANTLIRDETSYRSFLIGIRYKFN